MTSQSTGLAPGGTGDPSNKRSAIRNVRRWYLYSVLLATLIVVAIGEINLLELVIERFLSGASGSGWIEDESAWARERLSLGIPFILIGTPIWLLHWRRAQRAVQGEDAAAERGSFVRAAYFLVLILVGISVLAPALSSLVENSTDRLLGGSLQSWERESIVWSIATAVVLGSLWIFNVVAFVRDVREQSVEHRYASLPQSGLYIASLVGLLMLVNGLADLAGVGIDGITGAGNQVQSRDQWWLEPLASGVAAVVAGGVIWAAHWLLSERMLATSVWWGKGQRGSDVRRAYLLTILGITALLAIYEFSRSIDGFVSAALGVGEQTREDRLSAELGPLTAAVPFTIAWIIHHRRLLAEVAGVGFPIDLVSVRRAIGYLMALAGLVMASAGATTIVREIVPSIDSDVGWRTSIGQPVGLLIGGAALWGWFWWGIRSRYHADPEAEPQSTSRRAFLFILFGGGLVAFVIGLAKTLYEVLRDLLGVTDAPGIAQEINLSLGVTIVASAIALSHGLMLRRDMAVPEPVEPEADSLMAEQATLITLTGPAGGDFEEVVETIRQHLPMGYHLIR